MTAEELVEACLKETHVLTHLTHHIASAAGQTYNWTPDSIIQRIEDMGLDVKIRSKLKALMVETVEELK